MPSLTEHEKRILDLIQSRPEIVGDKEARKKVASQIGMSEKTLRNRIADLKRYGLVSAAGPGFGVATASIRGYDRESDWSVYLQVLLRRWRLVLANFFLVAVVVASVSFVIPKTFRATSVIMPPTTQPDLGVLSAFSQLPLPGLKLGVGETETMTFLAILSSRTVLERVIQELGLVDFYRAKNMEEAVKALRDNVIHEIEDEGTITVSVDVATGWFPGDEEDDRARQLSADIANHLVSNLDLVNKRLKTDQARFQREFIEKRYNQNIGDMKEAEERLKAFQEKYNMIALPEQTGAAIQAAAAIKAEILASEVKMNVMSQVLSSDHPDVGRIRKQIGELNSQLQKMEKGSGGRDLFPGFSEVPELGIQLVRLERDVEIQNALFTFLTQQYEEAKIKEAKDTPTVQVLDPAVSPERKFKPKRAILVAFYSFLSIIFTSAYVLFKPGLLAFKKNLST